jgi:hypothetical protein
VVKIPAEEHQRKLDFQRYLAQTTQLQSVPLVLEVLALQLKVALEAIAYFLQ